MLLIVVAAAVAVAGLAPGAYERYPRTALVSGAQVHRAPAWSEPCWATAPRRQEVACVHVKGRVVWVQHHDPDGDGDRHLIVMARLRPRIVKISRELLVTDLPGIGTRVEAVGWLMTGGSGHDEVDAMRLIPAGPPE
ncbi:MAG TPA: hypothetical protein VGO71_15650 [Baekduia sp.]|nr:hypothetical protein [Baekduia sp.]